MKKIDILEDEICFQYSVGLYKAKKKFLPNASALLFADDMSFQLDGDHADQSAN